MATVFQEMRNRMQRRYTYECGGNDPSFRVRALGLKGMKINSTDREMSDDTAAELADMWTTENPPTVWLTISSNGVRVTDVRHNDVIWYDINEIAHCNVHRDLDNVFVFVGQQNNELRCHAILCSDAAKARSICQTMSVAFQRFFREWKRDEAAKNRSLMIESAGKSALLKQTSRKQYASDGNLAVSSKNAELKKGSVMERLQQIRLIKKPSKWTPIPADDESDCDVAF